MSKTHTDLRERQSLPPRAWDHTLDRSALDHATRLIHRVCCLAGEPDLISEIRTDNAAIRSAIKERDTPAFGRLNQTAYSLYSFIRDIADNDLVGWIEGQLASAAAPTDPGRHARMRHALLDPLRYVYGVSDKVLSMALSVLLLAAPKNMRLWAEVGAGMVAIDTLVHNFLVRTGILRRFNADHLYGPACYRPGGCADIIECVADRIDASQFNQRFPKSFPRFVQHAIWRFCAENGLDVCNGNRINDDVRCDNAYCQVRSMCDRVVLRSNVKRLGRVIS